jgi:hypothetical protein
LLGRAACCRRLVVDGLLHRAVEVVARRAGGVARAAGPVGVGGDHELALRVDEDALAEDAARGKAAVVVGPPLVAVAAPGLADAGVRSVVASPASRRARCLPADARAVEDELPEAREVARGGLDAAAADLLPVRLRIQVACCSMPAGTQIFSDRYCDSGFFVAWLTRMPTRLVSPVL